MYGNVLKLVDQLPILPLSKDIVHRHWATLTTKRRTDLFATLVRTLVPCEHKPQPRELLSLIRHIHYVVEPQLSKDKPRHLLLYESPACYREALGEWPRVSEKQLLARIIDKLQNKKTETIDHNIRSPILLAMFAQYHYLLRDQILIPTGKTMKRRTQLGFTYQGYNDTPITFHQLSPLGDLEPQRNYNNRARRQLNQLYNLLDMSYPAISTVHCDILTNQLIQKNVSRSTKRLYTQLLVQGYTFKEEGKPNGKIQYSRINI